MRNLLMWLLAATRGGPTRTRILQAIRERPMNAHQLAKHIGIDYRAVRHHLRILEENHLLVTLGEGYGEVYFLSKSLEANLGLLDEIRRAMVERDGGHAAP